MIFNNIVEIYTKNNTFEYGEEIESYIYAGNLMCYVDLKESGLTESERMPTQDRKQVQQLGKIIYGEEEISLSHRDIIKYDGTYYRLLSNPIKVVGMGQHYYQVIIVNEHTITDEMVVLS